MKCLTERAFARWWDTTKFKRQRVQFVALFLDLNNRSVSGGAACPTRSTRAKHWILSYSTSLWTRLSCGGAAVMWVWSTSGGLKVGAHCNSEVKILGLISVTFRTADTTDSTNTTILGFQNRAAVASSSGILWNRGTPRWLMTQARFILHSSERTRASVKMLSRLNSLDQ